MSAEDRVLHYVRWHAAAYGAPAPTDELVSQLRELLGLGDTQGADVLERMRVAGSIAYREGPVLCGWVEPAAGAALDLDIPYALRPGAPHETLLYYDGPLLFWLPAEGRHLLAVALLDGPHGAWPFLVAELSAQDAQALLSGQKTLQSAVKEALGWWLMPDYDAERLEFRRLTEVPAEWLPGDVFLTPAAG